MCFPSLPPILQCRFESRPGLEFSDFSMWHFLKYVVWGFLRVLRFPTLLHRFILSSERVFGGVEFEPMLTPREKSPLPENVPRGGSNPRRCGQRAQTLPTSYSGPVPGMTRPGKDSWRKRESNQGAGIMEADHRQMTTVFTVQPSFHHRHSTNRVS